MLTLDTSAGAHLALPTRRLTICGVVYRKDGSTLRCTQHDEDIEIMDGDLAGTYYSTTAVSGSDIKSSSDLSVDNMEISGYLSDDLQLTGFTVPDIEGGLFNNAPFETFICQWDAPNDWQKIMRRGYLGEISRTAEGSFQAEWRGMLQLLQQNIGRTYGERCDVKRFGDARCKLDVDALAEVATVSAVTSRRRFNLDFADSPAPDVGFFDLGELTFTTGANAGFLKQVKRDAVSGTQGQFELWDSLPFDVQVGDALSVKPGCDRRFETCQSYENVVNFRGHGRWIPGLPKIIRAP